MPHVSFLAKLPQVVSRMLASAGVKPSDLEVAEVHDCFEPWLALGGVFVGS